MTRPAEQLSIYGQRSGPRENARASGIAPHITSLSRVTSRDSPIKGELARRLGSNKMIRHKAIYPTTWSFNSNEEDTSSVPSTPAIKICTFYSESV